MHIYSIMLGHSLTHTHVDLVVEEPHPMEILPATFVQYLQKKKEATKTFVIQTLVM